jgi:hypothetical protein
MNVRVHFAVHSFWRPCVNAVSKVTQLLNVFFLSLAGCDDVDEDGVGDRR